MLYALVIFSCINLNDCIINKRYFSSLGECKAEQNFAEGRLQGIKHETFCIEQQFENLPEVEYGHGDLNG